MTNIELLDEIKRIKAIANTGLLYSGNEYDKGRYLVLQEIIFKLLVLTANFYNFLRLESIGAKEKT